jgi:hypothetical protein
LNGRATATRAVVATSDVAIAPSIAIDTPITTCDRGDRRHDLVSSAAIDVKT